MLTENELEWLKDRPWYPDNQTFRSMPDSRWYAVEFACRDWLHKYPISHRIHWLSLLYYTSDSESRFLRDAVEFEARVAVDIASRYSIPTSCRVCPISKSNFCQDKFKKRFGFACWSMNGSAWLQLKTSRLKVEEDMDNAD